MQKILVTGVAGFIGFHTARALLADGMEVVGLDNLNDYYDVNLKYARLAELGIDRQGVHHGKGLENFSFVKMDLEDYEGLHRLFAQSGFDTVIHLAAQAGVRYSLTHPHAYIQANITGFLNILECCRAFPVQHLVYASSSSVYGKNASMPFSTSDHADHPVSLYAATKKSNELMAHTYSHLFGVAATGLRFFTVYGPWGRPDMALFIFTKAILEGRPIQVFNQGDMLRDFTYVDDIVKGIVAVARKPATPETAWDAQHPDPAGSNVAHRVYNIGSSKPAMLTDFISAIEKATGKTAIREMLPMQAGDVRATFADTTPLLRDFGYTPQTKIEDGILAFVAWYKTYYGERGTENGKR